jgi:hypothetical protein
VTSFATGHRFLRLIPHHAQLGSLGEFAQLINRKSSSVNWLMLARCWEPSAAAGGHIPPRIRERAPHDRRRIFSQVPQIIGREGVVALMM